MLLLLVILHFYNTEMIASSEPILFEELSLRRSHNFKDPSRPMTANTTGMNWNKYPTKQLSKVITPKILKMDREGCESIRRRIEYEQAIEEMINGMSQGNYAISNLDDEIPKSWVQENRLKIRQKFLRRHEENIEKERKAGIYKDYRTISEKSYRHGSTRNRQITTSHISKIIVLQHCFYILSSKSKYPFLNSFG
jgi:hypothetical protein